MKVERFKERRVTVEGGWAYRAEDGPPHRKETAYG